MSTHEAHATTDEEHEAAAVTLYAFGGYDAFFAHVRRAKRAARCPSCKGSGVWLDWDGDEHPCAIRGCRGGNVTPEGLDEAARADNLRWLGA